ncbi:protein FLX-like 2 [Asparagus officinalis]|nr:protein FLX-like 2 [Asparagus officinalis]
MGSKGRVPPPSHLRQPLPGPGMLRPDPFGPGIRPPPGAFPFDMLPPPEVMEQRLAAQDFEMQKLLRENQRLAATHSVLRQELAANQHELQRLTDNMRAMKDEQEQHMRGLIDRMSKMEADLKASETVKVELQQAHAEARSLMEAKENLMAKAQQLNQDLQKSHADVQQVPPLLSELHNLNQEYQHCRATYDYEKKLRSDHYESLQLMEKNYMSMRREVEKLRAELTNSTNLDKIGGGSYGNSGEYKENDTSGQHSVGQNAYGDVYANPQGRASTGGGPVMYGGGLAGAAHTHPGYDASRVAAGYDNSKGGSFDPPKGTGAGYDAATKATGVAQAPTTAGNVAASYGSAQTASPYGSTRAPSPYGSAQAPNPYGFAQAPNPYGAQQAQNPYGSAQAPNPYGAQQAQNPYASAQAPNPYASAQAPNAYASAQAPNAYGSAQAPTAGGSARR